MILVAEPFNQSGATLLPQRYAKDRLSIVDLQEQYRTTHLQTYFRSQRIRKSDIA